MPPYIYIGRDIDTSDTEKQFISEYIGPGFYGVKYAPFMIPDPTQGLATLHAAAGMNAGAARPPARISEDVSTSCRAEQLRTHRRRPKTI